MNNGENNRQNDDDIDLVHFDHSGEIDRIRENEIREREIRARRVAKMRRQERLRRARIERLKRQIVAWVVLVGGIAAVIAVIVGVVTLVKKRNKAPQVDKTVISEDETKLLSDFAKSESIVYTSENNKVYTAVNGLLSDYTLSKNEDIALPLYSDDSSTFLWQVLRFAWCSDKTYIRSVKDNIRDIGMYSNGYIWCSKDSMKSPQSGFYLYDTNARFISAVAQVCLWEADTSFLYETDATTHDKLDSSLNLTVLNKLEKASDHFFDTKDINGGGIRYNAADGLVYVLTSTNNGSGSGAGSNYWYNFRFGYLDAYNNIAFNEAMCDLAKLYTLMGQTDKAEYYDNIAKVNKTAINNKFWNDTTGRYVGSIDTQGTIHDNGFVFLNLEALSSGIADAEQAKKIFSWLDGEREIATDSSTSADIYSFGFTPRSTTVKATDTWWDYAGGRFPLSAEGAYGKYWQNGGAALITEYYDLAARKIYSQKTFGLRVKALTDAYNDGTLAATTPDTKSGISGLAECGTAPSALVYTLFGISNNGTSLEINPSLYDFEGAVGIKNVSFGDNSYSLLFEGEKIYITAKNSGALKLKIGELSKNTDYEVQLCENGKIKSTEPAKTDKNGVIELSERFGDTSYVSISKVTLQDDKTKK